MASANVIELNGKRYDAMTGKFLGPANEAQTKTGAKSIAVVAKPSGEIAPPLRRHTPAEAHSAHIKTAPAESTVIQVRRGAPHHAPAPHKPQHTNTLMRHAVKPPVPSLKRAAKAQTSTGLLTKKPNFDIVPKHFVAELDEERLKRASHIDRSGLVQHFDRSVHVPVVAAPNFDHPATSHNLTTALRPNSPAAPRPIPTPKQRSQEIFDRALAQASSHKQVPTATKRASKRPSRIRSLVNVGASSIVILLIIGFIAYQNASSIQLRIASSRAGINATLPNWRPEGFSLGSLSYKPGLVSLQFSDTKTSRNFTVTQAASRWDNSALLSDFILPNNQTFETIQVQNNTIYTYGDNNATWVNGSIWYKLTTDGSLSTSQLVKLATSM